MASPALIAAIGKIGGEDKLADLPDELNDDGWQVILDGFRLEPLQFTALKKHRMAMVRQQQHEEQGQHPKKIKTSFSLDRPEDALESVKAWASANQLRTHSIRVTHVTRSSLKRHGKGMS